MHLFHEILMLWGILLIALPMKSHLVGRSNRTLMDKTALRQKLGMELKKAHALELSRAEKVKANKLQFY